MTSTPQDSSLDSTLALKLDPYGFISKRCDRYRSDIFATRLLLSKTLCMRGSRGALL